VLEQNGLEAYAELFWRGFFRLFRLTRPSSFPWSRLSPSRGRRAPKYFSDTVVQRLTTKGVQSPREAASLTQPRMSLSFPGAFPEPAEARWGRSRRVFVRRIQWWIKHAPSSLRTPQPLFHRQRAAAGSIPVFHFHRQSAPLTRFSPGSGEGVLTHSNWTTRTSCCPTRLISEVSFDSPSFVTFSREKLNPSFNFPQGEDFRTCSMREM
jgi:hypothetical protein